MVAAVGIGSGVPRGAVDTNDKLQRVSIVNQKMQQHEIAMQLVPVAISRCCIFRCRCMQYLRVVSPLLGAGLVCIATSTCACKKVLLQDPAALPLSPKHYPHKHFILWPSRFLSDPLERVQQRTAEQIVDMLIPQVMYLLSRPHNLNLRNVFLRGFVNRWWTPPFRR